MDELLSEFLKEAPELLQQASDDLLALEQDPGNAARLDSMFRAVHTLKGSVALFDFAPMGAMLHVAEDVLGTMRAGQMHLDRDVADAVIACVDVCEHWIAAIADTGQLPPEAAEDAARIIALLRNEQGLVAPQAQAAADRSEPARNPAQVAREAAVRTLRVDVERIDELVDTLGDLIVAKNGLAHLARRAAHLDAQLARDLANNQGELDRLIGSLQRSVMRVRMVPLSRTFQRFPRLIRDIATRLGKTVAFRYSGETIEADRSIVDGLFDPLLHVLRNAVDHGIEDGETRRRAGKPPEGQITLEARRDRDFIVVQIRDDGRGIDPAKLRERAKNLGLATAAEIDGWSDEATTAMVFAPGMSTAEAVSDVSGRGVGMDAAHASVKALGGTIELRSVSSAGTTVTLRFPQVAVITTVLLVKSGADQYGIPLDALQETTRIPRRDIRPIKAGAAFVLRDRTVPLLGLTRLLGANAPATADADAKIVVVKTHGQVVGVEVDGFGERTDVMLRPPVGMLAEVPGILGNALLGDGSVLLVLNLPELIE